MMKEADWGSIECWVNCELFISQMELQLEDKGHHDGIQ